MNDELIHFVSTWIFRDSSSVHVRDMEFVNPYVSKAVCDLCQSNVGPVDALPVGSANVVHSYLKSSATLVWKRFVFFTVNEHNQHWWGMVAVNPWKAILQQTFDKDTFDDEKQYNQVVLSMCGTIIVDGLESDGACKECTTQLDRVFTYFCGTGGDLCTSARPKLRRLWSRIQVLSHFRQSHFL